jgi:hypothetical protein
MLTEILVNFGKKYTFDNLIIDTYLMCFFVCEAD